MNKRIHAVIIMAIFCVNMSLYSAEPVKESPIESVLQGIFNQSFNKRSSLIDPKTGMQTLSEIQHSQKTASEEPKDADYIELTRQKLGFDIKPLLFAILSLGSGTTCFYYTSQNKSIPAPFWGVVSGLFALITNSACTINSQQNDGKAWLKQPTEKVRIILAKQEDGSWAATYQKSQPTPCGEVYLNMSDAKPLKIDQQKIDELAKEIIANHDANVKQEDLYSSQIFKDLAAAQK